MKKSKLLITALVLAGMSAGGFHYLKGTPTYSLYQIAKAVRDRDVHTFRKHFDLESITGTLVDEIMQETRDEMEKKKPGDEWEKVGAAMGKSFLEMILPMVKKRLKNELDSQLTRLIENAGEGGSPLLALSLVEVVRRGKTAEATVKKDDLPLSFKMRQTPERYWQVVSVDRKSLEEITEEALNLSAASPQQPEIL